MRVRGLKHVGKPGTYSLRESHPMRVRGLKHVVGVGEVGYVQSHPMRVRGLKLMKWQKMRVKTPHRTPCGCAD